MRFVGGLAGCLGAGNLVIASFSAYASNWNEAAVTGGVGLALAFGGIILLLLHISDQLDKK